MTPSADLPRSAPAEPPPASPALPAASRFFRRGEVLLALALLGAYLPTLARGVTFSDGPEILTAIATLGVAHPTGYPVFTVLAHGFSWLLALPLQACVKVEIFNALLGVGAALFTAEAARWMVLLLQGGKDEGERCEADLAGLGAGLSLGLCPLLWEQVRIPEVYPFHLFLVAAAGLCWVRFEVTRRDAWIVLAALPMGVGLAHHVTMVYLLPAAFLYLLFRKRMFLVAWIVEPLTRLLRLLRKDFRAGRRLPGWWGFPLACLIGALPLLSYGYLIWANAHTTGVSWGGVHDLDGLYRHMTGAQYRGAMSGPEAPFLRERLAALPGLFGRQFLPTGALLAVVGAALTLRRATCLFVFLIAVLIFNVAHGVQYDVDDYVNYYLPALFPCALFLGAGLGGLLRRARALARVAPALIVAALGLVLAPVSVARALEIAATPLIGEGYGEELALSIPPGSVLMTQDDGYLFTLWYEAHVLGRARDVATLDLKNVSKPWVQRYVRSHHPASCDPRAPLFLRDPAALAARCGTFEQRMALGDAESWASLGQGALDPPPPRARSGPPEVPVIRGAEAVCARTSLHAGFFLKRCGCYKYLTNEGLVDESCVHSHEEGGMVPREEIEVVAQRIIEDAIDQRPVFESNIFTHRSTRKGSPRSWDGPAYQRVSGDYALVNRGRYAQILHAADAEVEDACAGEHIEPLHPRPLEPPGPRPLAALRRPYRPNRWPTLIAASFLTPTRARRDDDARRLFHGGEEVHLQIEWFERAHYDALRADRQGAPLRHGLRVCFFDPAGRRLAMRSLVSGEPDPEVALKLPADAAPGTYRVQGCSVGDLDEGGPAEGRPCRRIVLEYAFTVETR